MIRDTEYLETGKPRRRCYPLRSSRRVTSSATYIFVIYYVKRPSPWFTTRSVSTSSNTRVKQQSFEHVTRRTIGMHPISVKGSALCWACRRSKTRRVNQKPGSCNHLYQHILSRPRLAMLRPIRLSNQGRPRHLQPRCNTAILATPPRDIIVSWWNKTNIHGNAKIRTKARFPLLTSASAC
jgi:hypothetical protein